MFVNHSVIDHELLNKIINDVGKVTKSPSHLAWSFCLVGSYMLRAYLFFIYEYKTVLIYGSFTLLRGTGKIFNFLHKIQSLSEK